MPERSDSTDQMLRDFSALFGVGVPGGIPQSVDVGGVAFSAIQGLYEMVKQSGAELDALRARTESAASNLAEIRRKLNLWHDGNAPFRHDRS